MYTMLAVFRKIYRLISLSLKVQLGLIVALGPIVALFEILVASVFSLLLRDKIASSTGGFLTKFFPETLKNFESLVWIFIGVGIIRGIGIYLLSFKPIFVELKLVSDFRNNLAFKSLSSDGITNLSPSLLMHLTGTAIPRAAKSVGMFSYALANVLIVAGLFISMFFMDVRIAIFFSSGLLIVGTISLLFNSKVSRKYSMESKGVLQLTEIFQRISANWILIRILGKGSEEIAKIKNIDKEATSQAIVARRILVVGAVLPAVLGVLLLAGSLVYQKSLDIETEGFVAMLYLFVRLVQYLTSLMQLIDPVYSGLPSLRDCAKYIESISRQKITSKDLYGRIATKTLITTPPFISIERVSHRFENQSQTYLKNVSLKVYAGEQIGIQGESGVGKSTLMMLMLGLIEPDSGKILINDLAPAQFRDLFSDSIAYVGAKPYLVQGSIRENLQYCNSKKISLDAQFSVLQSLGLKKWIEDIKNNRDDRLHEDDSGISDGEKQRLCLARALLREPLLFILDEPTANLDAESEAQFVKCLSQKKGECTTIIVSHRPQALRYCDRVFSFSADGLVQINIPTTSLTARSV